MRTIDATQIDAWTRCMGVGFLFTVADGYGEYFLGDVDLQRAWGAFDGEQVVGTLRSFATPFTVPGPSEVTVAALTNVTVSPTHRRRGLLTEMITAELRATVDREEPVGILIASEYPIYGRFGYGPAIEAASYTVDLAPTRFAAREGPRRARRPRHPPGPCTRLYERFRARPAAARSGATPGWWDRVLHQVDVPGAKRPRAFKRCAARRPDGGGLCAVPATQTTDHMRPTGELVVDELVAVTPAAYDRLWRYCCEVDLVATLRAGDRPVDRAPRVAAPRRPDPATDRSLRLRLGPHADVARPSRRAATPLTAIS